MNSKLHYLKFKIVGGVRSMIKTELIGKLVGILLIVLIITSAFSGAVFAPERK